MNIDSHVYLGPAPPDSWWHALPSDYVYLPKHLKPQLDGCALQRIIAVAAVGGMEKTRWLLELADRNAYIGGVVGWMDWESSDPAHQLDTLCHHPKFIGVRKGIENEQDIGWIVSAEAKKVFKALSQHQLVLDLSVDGPMLHRLADVSELLLQIKVAISVSLPVVGDEQATRNWDDALARIAADGTTFCKLPGLAASPFASVTKETRPRYKFFVERVLDHFGTDRVMYASHWPACGSGESYLRQFDTFVQTLRPIAPDDYRRIYGGNAESHYRLGDMAWFVTP